jgi:hypothetical protein
MSKLTMMGNLLVLMGLSSMYNYRSSKAIGNTPAPDDVRRKPEVNKIKNRDRLLQEGQVKEWTIDDITVTAINEKNAIRKVNNIKKAK